MRALTATVIGLLAGALHAQPEKTDAELIRGALELYGDRSHVDCDSCEGVTPCIRVCTDLEFLRLDSIMEVEFQRLLAVAPNDSARAVLHQYQGAWLPSRRGQCGLLSGGGNNSHEMVFYVFCLSECTQRRTDEIISLRKSLDPEE